MDDSLTPAQHRAACLTRAAERAKMVLEQDRKLLVELEQMLGKESKSDHPSAQRWLWKLRNDIGGQRVVIERSEERLAAAELLAEIAYERIVR